MKFLSNKKKNKNKTNIRIIQKQQQQQKKFQTIDRHLSSETNRIPEIRFFLLIKINDNRLTNQTNGIMKKQRIFVLIETKNKKKFRFNF